MQVVVQQLPEWKAHEWKYEKVDPSELLQLRHFCQILQINKTKLCVSRDNINVYAEKIGTSHLFENAMCQWAPFSSLRRVHKK